MTRTLRSAMIGRVMAIAVKRVARWVLRVAMRQKQYWHERAMSAELQQLDDVALKDLGLHRSEIGSLAAEVSGTAQPTRRLAFHSRN
jgi:uncharacterized protein YjiS (DUF1127 family)